jgi:hypothetical protein
MNLPLQCPCKQIIINKPQLGLSFISSSEYACIRTAGKCIKELEFYYEKRSK